MQALPSVRAISSKLSTMGNFARFGAELLSSRAPERGWWCWNNGGGLRAMANCKIPECVEVEGIIAQNASPRLWPPWAL